MVRPYGVLPMLSRTRPDKRKACALLEMAEETHAVLGKLGEHPTHAVKEYYETIRALLDALLLLDGYRTQGVGAHKELIDYHGKLLTPMESVSIDELRQIRNRISYEGVFIKAEYLDTRRTGYERIIKKLLKTVKDRLEPP